MPVRIARDFHCYMRTNSIHFIEDPGLWLSVRADELALPQRDGRYIDLSR